MKKNLINQMAFILLFTGLLMPAVSFAEQPTITAQQFAELLEQARAAQKKANSVDGEWRDVEKTLKAAEQAAQQGDLKKAEKLAVKAKLQSEIGYQQAVAQKGSIKEPSFLN